MILLFVKKKTVLISDFCNPLCAHDNRDKSVFFKFSTHTFKTAKIISELPACQNLICPLLLAFKQHQWTALVH